MTIAAHAGPLTELATVVLPSTSWAEQSGTYVNAKGMRQVSEKALEPQGVSKPGWRQVSDVASALGYEAAVDEAEADPRAAHRRAPMVEPAPSAPPFGWTRVRSEP